MILTVTTEGLILENICEFDVTLCLILIKTVMSALKYRHTLSLVLQFVHSDSRDTNDIKTHIILYIYMSLIYTRTIRLTPLLAGFDTNMYVETRPHQCHITIQYVIYIYSLKCTEK